MLTNFDSVMLVYVYKNILSKNENDNKLWNFREM